jgi:hypothetical protein
MMSISNITVVYGERLAPAVIHKLFDYEFGTCWCHPENYISLEKLANKIITYFKEYKENKNSYTGFTTLFATASPLVLRLVFFFTKRDNIPCKFYYLDTTDHQIKEIKNIATFILAKEEIEDQVKKLTQSLVTKETLSNE